MFSFQNSNQIADEDKDAIIKKALGSDDFDTFNRTNEQYKKSSEQHAESMIQAVLNFHNSTQSITDYRAQFTQRIPKFWSSCLKKHDDIKFLFVEEEILEFFDQYLINLSVMYSTHEKFKTQISKYGKEGVCFLFHFKKNPYFRNEFLWKACGKKKNESGEEIGFCEGERIEWVDKEKMASLMGDEYWGWGLDFIAWRRAQKSKPTSKTNPFYVTSKLSPNAPGPNGETIDVENSLNILSWIEHKATSEDEDYTIDDDGMDKVARAISDEIWSEPVAWFKMDSDDESSEEESDSFEPESDMDGF